MCSARDPTERHIYWISGSPCSSPDTARHVIAAAADRDGLARMQAQLERLSSESR